MEINGDKVNFEINEFDSKVILVTQDGSTIIVIDTYYNEDGSWLEITYKIVNGKITILSIQSLDPVVFTPN